MSPERVAGACHGKPVARGGLVCGEQVDVPIPAHQQESIQRSKGAGPFQRTPVLTDDNKEDRHALVQPWALPAQTLP